MADRYRTSGGWTVEVVRLGVGERLRIRHHGFYIADGPLDPPDELELLKRATLIPAA